MKRAKQELFENNKHSVLVVDELTKKYGKFLAVDHVSFCVESNECFGVLGPNGAGKTSTFKVGKKIVAKNEKSSIVEPKLIF